MEELVLVSMRKKDLQTLIIECVNSCLANHPNTKGNHREHINKLLTVQDAAKLLHITVPTVYSKVSKGEIPFMKRGKRLYFSQVDLMRYVKGGNYAEDDDPVQFLKKGGE